MAQEHNSTQTNSKSNIKPEKPAAVTQQDGGTITQYIIHGRYSVIVTAKRDVAETKKCIGIHLP